MTTQTLRLAGAIFENERLFWLFRDYGILALTFVAAYTLPLPWIVASYIVLGQAHFLMSFLYQWRGGQMNPRYLFLAIMLIAGTVVYFSFDFGFTPILVLTAVAFPFHVAVDEIFLHHEKLTRVRFITALAFVALTASLILWQILPLLQPLFVTLIICSALWMVVRMLTGMVSKGEQYLFVVGVLFAIVFGAAGIAVQLGALILIHVFNWAVGYGRRVRQNPIVRRRYWLEMLLFNVAVLALFLLFVIFEFELLQLLFIPLYLDIWATIHAVLSFRPGRAVTA